ncbi:MAG: PKD domain-containing protein [Chloroflexota bacterium]|nr:MAG: PKD domain-containing protein [Chloroflexota bacterium]
MMSRRLHSFLALPFLVTIVLSLLPTGIWTQAAAREVSAPAGQAPSYDRREISAALKNSPLLFIENVGQLDPAARFQVRGGNGTMFLSEDALWLTLIEPRKTDGALARAPGQPNRPDGQESDSPRRGVNLRLSYAGSNPHPIIEPFDRLDTHVSYFIGADASKWHPDVPVWGGVRYRELYPGIDLEVTSEGGQLMQRMVARAGSDPSAVRLRVEGADDLTVDATRLALTTSVGTFNLPLLKLETAAGVRLPALTAARRASSSEVVSPFVAAAAGSSIQMTLDALSASASDLSFATFLGGGDDDGGIEIAVDGSGNAYVAGQTLSSDFPTTAGAYDTSYNGVNDAFVVKLNVGGSGLLYATFLGGAGSDYGNGVAVDGSGNAYVAGQTDSSNFPTTAGCYDTSFNGDSDAFVVKLNAGGSGLLYATFLGGGSNDWGSGIAVDGSGNAYVTGYTYSSDFPTTASAFDTSINGYNDAFVVKLDMGGSGLLYATFVGGSDSDWGRRIAVDGSGNAYVTGYTYSSDFPTTAGAYDTSFNGYYDAFVVKLAIGGGSLRADPTMSRLSAEPTSVPADGGTSTSVTVQLLTTNGTPVPRKTVRLSSSRGISDTITQPTQTGADGRATGAVRSTFPGSATLSAFVMDDGVSVLQTGSVTFEPYTSPNGDLVFQINQLVTTGTQELGDLENDATAIADYGNRFRGAVGQDAAKLAADVVFNMQDVVSGLNNTYHLQKAARLACPGCYVPGTWNVEYSSNHPAAKRLLDIGSMNLESAATSKMAEFVGIGGSKFFAEWFLNWGAEQVTKGVAQDAARTIFATRNDGISTVALPAIRSTSEDLSALLQVQGSTLLSNVPPIPSERRSAYARELNARIFAVRVLGDQLRNERETLANFWQAHEQNPNVLLDLFLRTSAKSLAKHTFDGPGQLAVGGSLTLFDGYMDTKRLTESMQMYNLATGALLGTPTHLQQTYQTAYRGLDRVRYDRGPGLASGNIVSVVNHNQGRSTLGGLRWQETASWTDVSLVNTGDSETTFRVLSNYLADTTRFGVPWATMSRVEEGFITLAPHTGGTVRVDYKWADGTRGFSPRSRTCIPLTSNCVPASDIYIDVLGTNDTGTYYIGGYNDTWQPIRVSGSGAQKMASDDSPTIDPPLMTYVVSAPWTQRHEAQIWINNPFTSTLPVTVTQTLSAGISVIDAGGANQQGSLLTWNTTVLPSAVGVVTFTFSFPAAPGADHALPAAVMSLASPIDGQIVTADSNVAHFQAIWPVTLSAVVPGYVLPGSSPSIGITVTNWLTNTTVAGSLAITVTDALSTPVHSQVQAFSVMPAGAAWLNFALPGTMSPGDYSVYAGTTVNGSSGQTYLGRVQVGVPGPDLVYRASAAGTAHPNDVLTYTVQLTNTVGVPLSNAALTATIPLSTTVVAGSVTGGGIVEPGQMRWPLGTLGANQSALRSFAVKVDTVGPPGDSPWRLSSQPTLTANEIAATQGPAAWNLVAAMHAGFTATPLTGTAPLTVTFTNQSTGDFSSSLWDFGDGTPTSTLTDPEHTFTTPGVYTVTLIVSGPGGTSTEVRPSYISVAAPPPGAAIRIVKASPNPFNPAQSGTTLSFDLTAPCGYTLAAIFDMNGAGVLKYWSLGARSAGTQNILWDGKNTASTVLGEGIYAFFAVCLDAGGSAIAVGSDLVNISPIISNMTVNPKPYYPQSGNAALGFNLSTGSWAFTTAVILNAQGAQVKVFPWAVSPSGAVSYNWDGEDGGGNVVPNGRYTYVVAAVDPSNTSQMHTGVLLFDVGTPVSAGSMQAEPWAQEAMEQLRRVGGVSP